MILAVNTFVHRYNENAPLEPIRSTEIAPAPKPAEAIAVPDTNENNKNIISPDPSMRNSALNSPSSKKNGAGEKEASQPLPYKILSVKVDIANVRDEPRLDSLAVGKLLKMDQLVAYQEYVDDSSVKWYQVSFKGEKRWIAEEVVNVMDVSSKEEQPAN
jgi:hypothetical protein